MVSSDGTALIADFGNAELRELTLKFTNTTTGGVSIRWTVWGCTTAVSATDGPSRHPSSYWQMVTRK